MRCLLAVLVLLCGVTGARADDEPVDPIKQLQADVERLKHDLEAERQARLKGEAEARSSPLGLRRGDFALNVSGLLQADAVAYRQSSLDELSPSGEPLNQTRFVIRAARLRCDLEYRWLFGALEIDANTVHGPSVRLFSGWAGLQWPSRVAGAPPYLALTVGLQRIPFGGELRERIRDRFFLERSNVVQALFPSDTDLGAVLQGGWRFLRYAVAAMNGNPVSDQLGAQFQARDPNQSKDFLGRLGAEGRFAKRFTLTGGFSAVYGTGFHPGTAASKDQLVWRDTDENGIVSLTEIQVIAGKSASPSLNFDRYAVGADLRFTAEIPRLGTLVLYGEIIWATNFDRGRQPSDPVDAGRTLRQFGWFVAATLELTRWAQLGVRYDSYNPDADTAEQIGFQVVPRDSSVQTLAVALAARWTPYGRLVLEYDYNRNRAGRDASGFPARLADDALTVRAQVQF